MKKVFFFDIDGTLIDCPKGITTPTKKTFYALKSLKAAGHDVVISTGRGKALIPIDILALPYTGLICANGNYVEYNNEIIFNNTFSKAKCQQVIDFAKSRKVGLMIEKDDYIEYIEYHREFKKMFASYVMPDLKRFNLRDTSSKLLANMFVLMHRDDEKIISDFANNFPDLQMVLNFGKSSSDIIMKGINKGVGIKKYLQKAAIARENTICFGDGLNDVDMFKSVFYPIGMGVMHDSLKPYAKDRCLKVEEEGIYNKLVDLKYIKQVL